MKALKTIVSLFVILALMASAGLSLAENEKINLNQASVEELATLKHIGPAIAERIVQYREENGNFTKIEDVMNVKGIGPKTFEKIQDLISVE